MVRTIAKIALSVTAVFTLAISGCQQPYHATYYHDTVHPFENSMPRELRKTTLPPYIIEPPDLLSIEALQVTPSADYLLQNNDVLSLQVKPSFADSPLDGEFLVGVRGEIDLGEVYKGKVKVAGLTIDAAKDKVKEHLTQVLKEPVVTLWIAALGSQQQIAGEHLVGPDGTVNLGAYGRVGVVGLTTDQAKAKIEQHLAKQKLQSTIAVDVFSYNSKSYYVITEGAGLGDAISKFPVTGNETVLDAVAEIQGLQANSSTRIWIARPSPNHQEVNILPVDWKSVTARGGSSTNYQLMPGDRVFIAEEPVVAWDNMLAKYLAPIERIIGFSLLGHGAASNFSGNVLQNGRNQGGGGGF